MGQSASRVSQTQDISKGILVTLDAFQTIYRFKKPVGEQYLDVARSCGLKSAIDPNDVTKAFTISYKSLLSDLPNYGKGKLASPEVWWNRIATDTFRQLVDEKDIPHNLGSTLYQHFTSNNAYELYPDAKPFFQSMRNLRKQFSNTEGPAVILGVITNSDPRARQVFESLSINVGNVQTDTLIQKATSIPKDLSSGHFAPPWQGAYDVNRDLDFLTTSYEVGAEKPSPRIFFNAQRQASIVMLGRKSTGEYPLNSSGLKRLFTDFKLVGNSVDLVTQMKCIHIGDELVKDYDGARNFGFDALLLDREGQYENTPGRIGSLDEAATIITLMAQEGFRVKSGVC